MKKLRSVFLLAVCILMIAGTIPAGAIIPYSTYTYDIDGNYVESPHAYVPYETISSSTLGLEEPISEPYDFCVGSVLKKSVEEDEYYSEWDGMLYISDSGEAPRVLAVRYDFETCKYSLEYELTTFVNNWGVPDSITTPRGLFATDSELYVCDTDAARILVFSTVDTDEYKKGDFIRIIEEPKSEVFPDNHIYKPVAVAVGTSGYIYVVSSTTYQGIISMNHDGEFTGFLGTQTQSMSLMDMIWRRFQTKEQRQKSVSNVSLEFNNINIDEKGFVYATTAKIDENDLMSAIGSRNTDSEFSPAKKLNPSGQDVMKRAGFFPPSGEINFSITATPNYTITGPSTIVDIALGPEGTWSIIDQKRQKIFTYDEDGNLLFAFGDKGSQLGNLTMVQAIDYADSNMLVLDKENDNITVFKRTSYGDELIEVLRLQRDRLYDEAASRWENILQRNSNFDMSYIGIGQSLYRQGKYEEAMESYKYAYDTENYSEAFQQVRKAWVEKYALVVPVVVVVFFIILSKIFKYAHKINVLGQVQKPKRTVKEELLYGFHAMFHPFDGFWDIKHEKRASVKGATIILVVTIASYIYSLVGKAYLIDPHPTEMNVFLSIASILLPIILWVVANWCLTTLFDGEGSMKDIYIATCYALFPLPAFLILTTLLSNIVSLNEASLLTLGMGVAYFWVGYLLFFGTMVIHDYTLFKNVTITIFTIVGMAFIMFIGVLFSSLVGKIVSFISAIITELSYRV